MPKVTPPQLRAGLDAYDPAEQFQLLVASIQDYAIFLLDADGHVSSWNLGAEKLKQYTPSEIIGKHFSIFYEPSDIARDVPSQKLEICNQEGRVEDEGWRIKKDGSRFWANVVITALRNPDGAIVGYAKVTRDLSERKRHEDELQTANEELIRQRLELEELNSIKDEFVALASHQLRTPATGVKQFLGLALNGYAGDLSEQQREFIQRAYDSNDRQIELVNDLLSVAQLDAGRVTLDKKGVEVIGLIIEIIEEQRDSFAHRQQSVQFKPTRNRITIQVDQTQFRGIIENLLDNAGKYTPPRGTISLSVEVTDTEVCIAVKDSGVGIASDQLPKLFSKFARIPNSLSDDVGGSGLGLYWAKKVAILHGGHIKVESLPGEGSTFTICLPKETAHV